MRYLVFDINEHIQGLVTLYPDGHATLALRSKHVSLASWGPPINPLQDVTE